MILVHAVILLIALAVTYGINWLAWVIPAYIFQEFGQFVIPLIVVLSTVFIAASDEAPRHEKKYLTRAILVGLICLGAWHYFSHLQYTSRVISSLEDDFEDPKKELYALYEEEFGVDGFLGYLLWSAKAGANISIEADDVEYGEINIPEGWWSFAVNWGYRLANLVLVVLWVTKTYRFCKQGSQSTSVASPTPSKKATPHSGPPQDSQALLQRGEIRRKQGDLDGAITDYTEALRLNPTSVAHCNRGNLLLEKGDLDGAIADYTEAIRLNPTDKWPYNRRGFARLVQSDFDGAIADITEVIRLDPEDAMAYQNRAIARQNKGDLDGAVADYNEARRRNLNNVVTNDNQASAYKGKKEKDDDDGAITDPSSQVQATTPSN